MHLVSEDDSAGDQPMNYSSEMITSMYLNWGNFGQWGDFERFFNISVLSLYKEFQDEIFLIVQFSYQSLWLDYLIVKFFVQTQYRGVERLSKVTPLSKVTHVDGINCFGAVA